MHKPSAMANAVLIICILKVLPDWVECAKIRRCKVRLCGALARDMALAVEHEEQRNLDGSAAILQFSQRRVRIHLNESRVKIKATHGILSMRIGASARPFVPPHFLGANEERLGAKCEVPIYALNSTRCHDTGRL